MIPAAIVLSVLAGEVTIAEAARREKVSEQSIGRWNLEFLAVGRTAVAAGKSGPSSREEQLEAEVADLTQALGEAAIEVRVWRKQERGGPPGPFEDLEVIRIEAGMPTARFCKLIGVPERTWRRWQAKARQSRKPKGPWPQPAREAAHPLATEPALAHPD